MARTSRHSEAVAVEGGGPAAPGLAVTASPASAALDGGGGAGAVRGQYFLSYAVLGAIMPFLSVVLAERGLSRAQIGSVWAVASLGVIVTPILVTLLADAAAAAGPWLMAGLFVLAGAFFAGLAGASGYAAIAALYALHMLALQPVFPLQDGIHFAAQAARRERGAAPLAYHAVRVWGTVGYIVPGAVLYFFLPPGRPLTGAVVTCGVACCLIGAANALRLPRRSAADAPERPASGLPTGAAARAIFGEPHVLVFCVAMFLLHMASQAYYQFYPLYLTDRAGIDKRFVGLIANVGVVVEIFFMLGFARLVRRLTLRRVMYLGAGAIGLRMLLLAVFANPIVAVGVQLLHGMTVLVVHVAPPIFLDARADDRYRNSIQGLYAMAFAGAGKVVGAWAAGRVAEHSLAWAFGGAGAICAVAVVLFYCAFHEGRGMRERNMKT